MEHGREVHHDVVTSSELESSEFMLNEVETLASNGEEQVYEEVEWEGNHPWTHNFSNSNKSRLTTSLTSEGGFDVDHSDSEIVSLNQLCSDLFFKRLNFIAGHKQGSRR